MAFYHTPAISAAPPQHYARTKETGALILKAQELQRMAFYMLTNLNSLHANGASCKEEYQHLIPDLKDLKETVSDLAALFKNLPDNQ